MSFKKLFGFQSFGAAAIVERGWGTVPFLSSGQALGQTLSLD